jgi:hypothetical protein
MPSKLLSFGIIMKLIKPFCRDTVVIESKREWKPKNVNDFFCELEHAEIACKGKPFYRGQRDVNWLLDSTFVRNAKKQIYGMQSGLPFHPLLQGSLILHTTLLNLFLTKFTYFINPSDELQKKEQAYDIDPWFEFFKQLQQDPGKWEHPEFSIHGTNIIDWSQSKDVGIFFANEKRKGEGALWVYDKCVVPKSHMVKKTLDIINLMDEKGNHPSPKALGIPCIFHPEKQIKHITATRQEAIYLAQMDMRYDLSQFWLDHEVVWGEPVFIKLTLPKDTTQEINLYLKNKGIDEKYIYPNETRN